MPRCDQWKGSPGLLPLGGNRAQLARVSVQPAKRTKDHPTQSIGSDRKGKCPASRATAPMASRRAKRARWGPNAPPGGPGASPSGSHAPEPSGTAWPSRHSGERGLSDYRSPEGPHRALLSENGCGAPGRGAYSRGCAEEGLSNLQPTCVQCGAHAHSRCPISGHRGHGVEEGADCSCAVPPPADGALGAVFVSAVGSTAALTPPCIFQGRSEGA